MKTTLAFIAAVSLWIATPVSQTGIVTGDVFIVARGGTSIKLGLVTVTAIPEAKLTTHLREKQRQSETELSNLTPAIEAQEVLVRQWSAESSRLAAIFAAGPLWDPKNTAALDYANSQEKTAREKRAELAEQAASFRSPGFYFDGVPPGIDTAKSDADGKFSLTIPSTGKFAIAARASREVARFREVYNWLVWVSLDGQASTHVMLSNDNMMGAGSPESAWK